MKKVKLHVRNGFTMVDADKILCNAIELPSDKSTFKKMLWILSSPYGVMGAVWADDEEEALDVLVDADLAGGILMDSKEYEGLSEDDRLNVVTAGNNGLPVSLNDQCSIEQITWNVTRDWKLMCKFAEARGLGCETLHDLPLL